MKKLFKFIAVTSLAFALVACNNSQTNEKSNTDAPVTNTASGEVAVKPEDEDSTKPEYVTKIALLISGTLGDKSFHDSSNAGITAVKEMYGDKVEVKVIEMGSDKTKFVPTLEDVSEEGYDLIVTGTFHMKAPLEEVAPQYPDLTYIIYDTSVDYDKIPGLENVYSITYKQNEAGFLAGFLAAEMTRDTNIPDINADKKIGFLGATDSPVINDFLVGYIEGATHSDKDTKVDVAYIDSFTDAARGKELSLIQYKNNGVDVSFNVAGRAGLGQVEAAVEAKAYAIGVDSDQASLFADSPEKADRIVSSALKRVDLTLIRAVEKYFDGTLPKGKSENLGIKDEAVGLAKNQYYEKIVPKEIIDKVSTIEKELIDGKITIDSAIGMDAKQLDELRNSVK